MSSLRVLWCRLRSAFSRSDPTADLDEELRAHLDLLTDENLRRGLTPLEARRQANLALGGMTQTREASRDARGIRWLSELGRDLRLGARTMRHNPVVSITVIATLGLGIGLTSTVFNITNGFVHKPLPFADANRVMVLGLTNPARDIASAGLTIHDLSDWRERQSAFEDVAVFGSVAVDLSSDPDHQPERYPGGLFSAGVLEALEVRPLLGRAFDEQAGDGLPNGQPVVILGYAVWQDLFAGAPNVIGRAVQVNGRPATVIGVMPEGFRFPNIEQVWLPITMDSRASARGEGPRYSGIARLRDGVSPRQAEASLAAVAAQLALEYPVSNAGFSPTITTLKQALVPTGYYGLFYMLLAAAMGVLLIACANVANLLTGRASGRTHEFAVRHALGAGRGRLFRQLTTEVLVLAIVGGVVGFGLGHIGLQWFTTRLSEVGTAVGAGELPFWVHFEQDYRVVLFVVCMTVFSGVAAGILPAFRASAPDAIESTKVWSRGSMTLRMGRLARGLIATEVTMSCVLLVLTGLMVKSALHLSAVDWGYTTSDVFTAWVSLPDTDYTDAESRHRFYEELLPRLTAVPGVTAAALSDALPPYRAGEWAVEIQAHPYVSDGDYPVVRMGTVTPDYFRTFDVPVAHGRTFTSADRSDTQPVAIVNETFARLYLSGDAILGQRIRTGRHDVEARWMTVVGVVPDMRALPRGMEGVQSSAQNPACFYIPMAQGQTGSEAAIALRTQGPPLAMTTEVRTAVRSVDPKITMYKVLSLEGVILRMTWFYPVFQTLFVAFGVGAILLAAVGLYGVMSFAVTRRTQEFGVRLALGAEPRRLVWLVMRVGMRPLATGLGIGLVLAALAAGSMQMLLYDVSAHDGMVFAIVVLTLVGVGFLACFIPARRVVRIDPMAALTAE